MTTQRQRDNQARGLCIMAGADPMSGSSEPWLSLGQARAVLTNKTKIEEAWAMYCLGQALRAQKLADAYCTAAAYLPV